jgi:hypothetical protein
MGKCKRCIYKLWWASFTYHNVFIIYPCTVCQYFFPFYMWVTFHTLFIDSPVYGHLSFFFLLAIVNNTGMNTNFFVFLFVLGIHLGVEFYLGMELLDHIVILCSIIWRTTKYHFIPTRVARIKKKSNKCWWGCGENQNLRQCWLECKL